MSNPPNDGDEVKGQELLGSLLDRFFSRLGDVVHDATKKAVNETQGKQAIDKQTIEATGEIPSERETPTDPAPPHDPTL